MKLTNTLRDAFIRAAMNDVPQVDYDAQIDKLFRDAAVAALPAKVRALLKDKECERYVHFEYRSFTGLYRNQHVPCSRFREDFKLPPEVQTQIRALIDKSEAQGRQRNDLERKLRGVAYGVTTRKALADALPEFVKYLPADEQAAARSLPVVANVVAEFVKAGWPKDAKMAKAA